VNGGWGTALTTLMFERVTIGLGSEGMGYRSDRFAHAIAADPEARADGEVRHALGEIGTELLAIKFGGYRTLTALQRGQIPGPEAGLAKVTLVNAAIKAGELIADVVGPEALQEPGEWSYMISFLPDRGGYSRIGEIADGSLRAASCPARPPGDLVSEWTVEPRHGLARAAAPTVSGDAVTGEVPWVPDAPGAGVLVVVGVEDGEPVAVAVGGAPVEDASRYDHT